MHGPRIEQARLKAGMSRGDLAFRVRELSGSRFKTTERNVRDWERGTHAPRAEVVPLIAKATGHPIEFFYEAGGDTDDEEEAALPDLFEGLMVALRPFADRPDVRAALQPLARLIREGRR